MRFFTFVTLASDHIFFSQYRATEVARPVFIIGHPRSGTTFLHLLLTASSEVVAFQTWHLYFPALTARTLLKPLINFLIKTGRTELIPEEIGHSVVLDKTEEEEMLFSHTYDSQFLNIGMLGFDEREHPELQMNDEQPREHRFRSMRFLHGCFQRHILYTGRKQIIAQTHFSTHRLKTMLEFYPDAKFIYIIRNPYHVVPSFLSLLHKTIEFRWGLKKVPADVLQRYTRRRYEAVIDLYRYFHTLQKNKEIPEGRVLVLPYELLLSDLNNAFDRIVGFTGITVSEELRQQVSERAKSQSHYQRKHQVMPLEYFGLTQERIARDFAFVFEEYGIRPTP
ncbi:MAG: sulfotransferase [Verrucomicrobiae bacterium]